MGAKTKVTKSITAENVYSDPVRISGHAAFWLSGTWAATVKLQRSADAGQTYQNVTDSVGTELAWTANVTTSIFEPSADPDVRYRFGVPTGSFTSGTVVGGISQ